MLVPNRNFQSPEYRYGFQGQEKDDEIKGIGNSLNYKYRMHDPRIGRFFAVDLLTGSYPYYTPYQFSGNRVIDMVELEGLEPQIPHMDWASSKGYKNYGDFYNRGGVLEKVEGWWVLSEYNKEAEYIHKYFNPEKGKWIRFDPIPPRSLTKDLDALGHHVVNSLLNNFGVDSKVTISAGTGEADFTRILGFQMNEGIKGNVKVKLFEFDGITAAKTFFKEKDLEIAILDGFSFEKLEVNGSLAYSKGLYAAEGYASFETDVTDELNLSAGGSASYSLFKGSGALDLGYSTKQNQFSLDWDMQIGMEFLSTSNKIPGLKVYGLDTYIDTNFEINFSISDMIKDLNKPLKNKNDDRRVFEYDEP